MTNLRHSNIHGHAKPEESDKEEHVSLRAAGTETTDGRRGSANRRKRRARRPTWFDNEEAREGLEERIGREGKGCDLSLSLSVPPSSSS